VRSLRIAGPALFDTEVTVKGYITWIYDCVRDVAKPKEPRARTQKRIDDDPTLCERAKFYLGSARDTPIEKATWVVDVPRKPNKLERARLPKEELAKWPKPPVLKVGDFVAVTGTFTNESPHAERNSDGLIVFASVAKTKPAKVKPTVAVIGPATLAAPPSAKPAAAAPMRKVVDRAVRNESALILGKGNQALAAKQYGEAIALYKQALSKWDRNHLAHYGLGGAHAARGDWTSAVGAFGFAAVMRPDAAMYRLWRGVALYELDPKGSRFDDAKRELEEALAIDVHLWRAHFYLGRIHRARGAALDAALSFTRAIENRERGEPGPYIALAELYRKWDYTGEALAVARAGATHLDATADASDVHFILGSVYDDMRQYAKAVEGYTKALELDPDNAKVLFQRGQAYWRLGKRADAKRDLDAYLGSAKAPHPFVRKQATTLLYELEATTR
jgi:tetratricopeptide (TPR) repeat protein